MEIRKEINGSDLKFFVSGRLDTTTAPELEKVLNESYEGMTKLTFDFENLEYISSAGLRVLVAAQKLMAQNGEMIICNINDEVREVFEITGLLEVFNIA